MFRDCIICSTTFKLKPNTSGLYCSISCSNSGRTGLVKKKNEEKYNKNPTPCIKCNKSLSYQQKLDGNQYCSSSCAVSETNSKRAKLKYKNYSCIVCNTSSRNIKFCSRKCEFKWKWMNITVVKILEGKISNRPTLKKYLLSIKGHVCWNQPCGITTWNGEPCPLQVDHIDGNPGNDLPDNLRLICPNCHAQTPSANGKNKGFGRKSRGLPR